MITSPAQHFFGTIIGHEAAKLYLKNALDANLLPHALLFQGASGLGKLSMAYALTKLANCERPGRTNPGGVCDCDACRKISEGIFADVLVVEPQGAAGQITLAGWKPGKDDPDGLQYYRFVDCRPMEGRKKVLIIRQADRMNVFLANYLLKLIEEPPSYLLMLLITHRPSDVLPTIRSRCAPVRFGPLSQQEMQRFALTSPQGQQGEDLSALIRLSEGRPGALLELISQAGESRRKAVAQQMMFFQQYGFLALFGAASEILKIGKSAHAGASSDVEGFEETLNLLQAWIRDAMISKTLSPEAAMQLLLNQDASQQVAAYAQGASLDGLASAVDSLQQAYEFAPRQADRNYVLENLLLKMGRAMRK